MTIEQKALELVNAERFRRGWFEATLEDGRHIAPEYVEALCRALEAHELDKSRHAAELREQAERFSEAVTGFWNYCKTTDTPFPAALSPFILAPVDPLVELDQIMREAGVSRHVREEVAERIRNGCLAIVKKEAVNG